MAKVIADIVMNGTSRYSRFLSSGKGIKFEFEQAIYVYSKSLTEKYYCG